MDASGAHAPWTGGWRAMAAGDLPAVMALAEAAHPSYPERPEVFAERLALAPAFCAVLDLDGAVRGYLVAHPWRGEAPPALDTLVGRVPEDPDAVHCHDCVITPANRGEGRLGPALATLEARAAAVAPAVTLVAVAGKEAFWARRGYAACALPSGALESYGAGAAFMVKPVAQNRARGPRTRPFVAITTA